jgi:acetyl-CoA acetyltransferase
VAHPLHAVAIAGIFNTEQARSIPGETSDSIRLKAALGAMADAGVGPADIDGVIEGGHSLVYDLALGPVWRGAQGVGIPAVLEAAGAILAGSCSVVLVVDGRAGLVRDASAAIWTRPPNEFVASWGMFTAAEFALVARAHMDRYGTTRAAMATVAATIRNNGSVHPGAVYRGRGPFTSADVLASRPVAEPFNLLDCATTSEGACGVVVTRADLAAPAGRPVVRLLGGALDSFGPHYRHPPSFDLIGRDPAYVNGFVGRRAAQRSFGMAECTPADIDVCEFYDPFSFEIIRQFEAFGFCGEGEGGDYVSSGVIAPGGRHPVTTDGGTMAYSHSGSGGQMLQRVARAVEQLRGECATNQVPEARLAMCSNGGAGALFTNVMVLGTSAP